MSQGEKAARAQLPLNGPRANWACGRIERREEGRESVARQAAKLGCGAGPRGGVVAG